mgnify:FL=1
MKYLKIGIAVALVLIAILMILMIFVNGEFGNANSLENIAISINGLGKSVMLSSLFLGLIYLYCKIDKKSK